MTNKVGEPKTFGDLNDEDKDLTMFTITNLTLTKERSRNMAYTMDPNIDACKASDSYIFCFPI